MKIIIIDDDKLVCFSLKTILEAESDIQVAAVGFSGEEAIHLYMQYKPDILLMDIQMSHTNGLEAGEKLLKQYPEARILFLTTFSDDEYIIKALKIGAKGYIIKQDIESIPPALKAVMSGQNVFGSEIANKLPSLMNFSSKNDLSSYDINERERDVFELVAKGYNNKEIADSLCLSEGTVRNYLSTILEKLGLRDRTQLAIFYYTKGGK